MKRTFLLSSLFALAIAGCSGGADDSTTTPASSGSNGAPGQEAPPGTTGSPNQTTDPPSPPSNSDACATTSPCIEADVTLTDGSTFHFAHEAIMSKSDGAISLRAVDSKAPFGISMLFKPNTLAVGQSYPSDVSSAVWMSVYRKHPSEEGKTRLSTAQHGAIVFTQTGATNAASAAGTFDGVAVIRNEPDDTTNITLTKGTFRAGAL